MEISLAVQMQGFILATVAGFALAILYDALKLSLIHILNLSVELTGRPLPPLKADVTVSDGDVIPLGSLRIHVLHTPGHTIGSCCYVVEGAIFSGDTLFKMSAGRTDFPTGSYPQLLDVYKRQDTRWMGK